MGRFVILAFSVALYMAYTANALSLLRCERYDCYNQVLTCNGRGSHTTEATGDCCRACYKLVGEKCGGIHDYLGVCREGLKCVSNSSGSHDPINKPEGVCKKKTAEVKLPRKWENLLKSGKVTPKLRIELHKIIKKIKELNRLA